MTKKIFNARCGEEFLSIYYFCDANYHLHHENKLHICSCLSIINYLIPALLVCIYGQEEGQVVKGKGSELYFK